MRKILVILIVIIQSSILCDAQEYKSVIIRNDTLSESGNCILFSDTSIYVLSRTRCQPNAQSCGRVRNMDLNLDITWNQELPAIRIGNENCIHSYNDSILVITGVNNSINQEIGYYHYELSVDGSVKNLISHLLPYESNFNYGSVILNDNLFMYGAAEEDVSNPDVDVDALILNHNFQNSENSYEYFDYGNLAVDMFDLQKDTDSTLVFFSRRRQPTYQSERDYIIEKINSDGSRFDLYNVKVPNEIGVEVPAMEVLADGKIAFVVPNALDTNSGVRIRFINGEGVFQFDVILHTQYVPSRVDIRELVSLADGGVLCIGQYLDKETNGPIERNGMLLKISDEGEVLWTRHFPQTNDDTGEYTRSFLFTAEELPNGDIVATGVVDNVTSDLWVLKVNSEGCFGEDDCEDLTVGLAEEIAEKTYINVYPNPISSGKSICIELGKELVGIHDFQLFDLFGNSIQEGRLERNKTSIVLEGCNSGQYVLIIDFGDRGIETKRIVIW